MAETNADRIAALCSRVQHQNWRENHEGGALPSAPPARIPGGCVASGGDQVGSTPHGSCGLVSMPNL